MSVNTNTGVRGTTSTPLGVKIIVVLGVLGTLFGMFAGPLLIISIPNLSVGIQLFVIAFLLLLSVLQLVLLIGLYKMNKTAYILYMVLLGLSLLGNLVSINIFGLLINGAMFAYLLTISPKFN